MLFTFTKTIDCKQLMHKKISSLLQGNSLKEKCFFFYIYINVNLKDPDHSCNQDNGFLQLLLFKKIVEGCICRKGSSYHDTALIF